ncbi:MAG: class I SAM-dependent methyltransferase [Verrucomicrobiota bacterium]
MKVASASSTAKVIAASTILLAGERNPSNEVAPGAAELCRIFLSTNLSDRCLAACAGQRHARRILRLLERMTLPGIIAHYWRRKRWIEHRCRMAIEGGFERIVILGAGFDTLGMRLSTEFARLEVVELDHPATQRVKRTALANNLIPLPGNFRLCEVDLTREKLPVTAGADKPTVFIIEGLLMYLSEDDVSTLFDRLHECAPPGTRVIFSFMSRWPDGGSGFRPHSRLIDWWLRVKHEPFTWAIEPEAIDSFLASGNFKLMEMALAHELDPRANLQPGSLKGENLVICELVPK